MIYNNRYVISCSCSCPKHRDPLIVQEQEIKTTDPDRPRYKRRLVCPHRFTDGCEYKEKWTDVIRAELDQPVEIEMEF